LASAYHFRPKFAPIGSFQIRNSFIGGFFQQYFNSNDGGRKGEDTMKNVLAILCGLAMASAAMAGGALGLPDVPIPEDNPQTAEKIALGARLFNDVRFSSTGDVSCATCHVAATAFTDSPLQVSEGIEKLTGTRNAPTVVNAAFNKTQFWDGRSPTLEDQALHPFLNPVEMGLPSHDPILKIVREDKTYAKAFKDVFGVKAKAISMDEVTKAIAAFERTEIAGDSPFDRWYFGGESDAISGQAVRGFAVFLGDGRCVSCHTIEQDFALFTDHLFHNVGIGINDIQDKVPELTRAFQVAKNGVHSRHQRCATSPLRRRTCTTAASRRCEKSSSTITMAE
jgi:cytochrome c peroxidase